MKIRIMKQEALDILKSNLNSTYIMYFKEYNNGWIYKLCQGDPFVDFKEVPYFELADLDFKAIGKTDFQNCKILQDNLGLTPSQASDERLWAGLCHDVFYSYVRKRWKMNDKSKKINKEKAIGEIQSRYFFKGGKRAGIYRNTLSKCWWVGRLTKGPLNNYEMLDKLGYNDFSTKVNDIFRNYTFISNPEILNGIIDGISYFEEEGIKLGIAKNVRPVLQTINAVGGGTLLDYWTSEEIKNLFIEQENNLLNGKKFIETISDNDDEDEDENEEKNASENDNSDDVIEYKQEVTLASRITFMDVISEQKKTAVMMYNGNVTEYARVTLGKTINDTFEYDGNTYKILNIEEVN